METSGEALPAPRGVAACRARRSWRASAIVGSALLLRSAGALGQPAEQPQPVAPEVPEAQPPAGEPVQPPPAPPAPPAPPPVQPAPPPVQPQQAPPVAVPFAPLPPPAPPAVAEPRRHGGAAHAYVGADNILRTTHVHLDFDVPVRFLGAESDYPSIDFTTLHVSVDPTLSLVNTDRHWLYVGTAIGNTFILAYKEPESTPSGFDVEELIDRSVLANVPFSVGYAYTLVDGDDGQFFRAGPEASLTIPTEGAADFVDLYSAVVAAADAYVPLRRDDAFNGLFLRANVGWSHTFFAEDDASLSAIPTRNGAVYSVSQIGFAPRDNIFLGLAGWINVWRDLSVGTAWGLSLPFNHPSATDPCVGGGPTGCVAIPMDAVNRNSYFGSTQLSVSYLFAQTLWAELAYQNTSSELQREGGIFYSPKASVSLSATLLVDHMVEHIRH